MMSRPVLRLKPRPESMNLRQATFWKSVLGKLAAVLAVLFLASAVDAVLVHFRESTSVVHMVSGDRVKVNGYLTPETKEMEHLSFVSSSPLLRLEFDAVHQGYWLGGIMWRGEMVTDPAIEPGKYRLVLVSNLPDKGQVPGGLYLVTVHPDALSRQRASTSLIQKYTGLPRWPVFLGFLGLTLLVFTLVFFLSRKKDELLLKEGKSEVFRVVVVNNQYEIAFGMGEAQGVKAGDQLKILNACGETAGYLVVHTVTRTSAVGYAPLESDVRPGYVVSLA